MINGSIDDAISILKQGGLVAFPTETVYGLGADAENPLAIQRLYSVKGRPEKHPVIVHLASTALLPQWASVIPKAAYALAEAFWPGPLTLILKRTARVSDSITGGQDTVGIRIPDHPLTLALLQEFGGGLAGPSANRFGRISPTTAVHVEADLGDAIDLILDGGPCRVGVESTIVAWVNDQAMILRPGMITAEQVEEVLCHKISVKQTKENQTNSAPSRIAPFIDKHAMATPVAPGSLASHYAPITPLYKLTKSDIHGRLSVLLSQGKRVGVIAYSASNNLENNLPPSQLIWKKLSDNPLAYATQLYGVLREMDQLQFDLILIEAVEDQGLWTAIADRVQRASLDSDF